MKCDDSAFRLSPRLAAAASFVSGGLSVCDVGTDHAYLPVFLIRQGICREVLACDIGELPLQNAGKTVSCFELENAVRLRISDGLRNVSPDEAEEVVICGLGGTQIVRILSAAEWLSRPKQRLILQPMTHVEDVRQFLSENSFRILEEKYVLDEGRYYCCMSASWATGPIITDVGFYYFGSMREHTPEALAFYGKQIDRIRKEAAALEGSGRRPQTLKRLKAAIDYYERKCDEGQGYL